MLKRIEITNYKSCRNTRLDDLGPFTVLVGRNGAGKSNILQFIKWGSRSSVEHVRVDATDSASGTLEFEIDGNSFRYSASTTWSVGSTVIPTIVEETLSFFVNGSWDRIIDRNRSTVVLERAQKKIEISAKVPALSAVQSLFPNHPIKEMLFRVTSFLSSIQYYPLNEQISLEPDVGSTFILTEDYADWLAECNSAGHFDDNTQLKLLHLFLNEPSKLNEIKALLGHDGVGIIDDISFDQFGTISSADSSLPNVPFWNRYRPAGTNMSLSFGDLSHGTRRVLQLVTSLVFDPSSVMLIEHPEDGIHPGLLRKVIDLIKQYSDQRQVIIASHSADVFNMVGPSDVRLVTMTDDGTAVRRLSDKEIAAAERFVSSEGSLSDFVESIQD